MNEKYVLGKKAIILTHLVSFSRFSLLSHHQKPLLIMNEFLNGENTQKNVEFFFRAFQSVQIQMWILEWLLLEWLQTLQVTAMRSTNQLFQLDFKVFFSTVCLHNSKIIMTYTQKILLSLDRVHFVRVWTKENSSTCYILPSSPTMDANVKVEGSQTGIEQ